MYFQGTATTAALTAANLTPTWLARCMGVMIWPGGTAPPPPLPHHIWMDHTAVPCMPLHHLHTPCHRYSATNLTHSLPSKLYYSVFNPFTATENLKCNKLIQFYAIFLLEIFHSHQRRTMCQIRYILKILQWSGYLFLPVCCLTASFKCWSNWIIEKIPKNKSN